MYSTTMKKSLLRAISIGSIILSVLYFTNFALILHEIQDIEYSSNGIVENGLLPLLATTRNREELSNSTKVRRQQNRHDDVLSLHPTSSEAGIFKNGDWWNDKKSYYDPIIYDQLQKTALKPYRNVTTAGKYVYSASLIESTSFRHVFSHTHNISQSLNLKQRILMVPLEAFGINT